MIDEKEITFFTIDLNDYMKKNAVAAYCMKHFQESFPEVKFKIYTQKDKLVKDCLEEFKDFIEFAWKDAGATNLAADIIRLYILSKKKNHVYLDGDMFIKDLDFLKKVDGDKSLFFLGGYQMIYSGSDHKKFFQKLLDYYRLVSMEDIWQKTSKMTREEKMKYCYENFIDFKIIRNVLGKETDERLCYEKDRNHFFHFEASLAGGKNYGGVKFYFSEKSKQDYLNLSPEEKEQTFNYAEVKYGGIIAKYEEYDKYGWKLIPWDFLFNSQSECLNFLRSNNIGAIFL